MIAPDKRKRRAVSACALLATVFFGFLLCLPARAAEKINAFDDTIRINPDASISVSEKIVYDFGAAEHHGIFRDIPVEYRTLHGPHSLGISDIAIVDASGTAYRFEAGREGNMEHIQIGDPGILISGVHTYVLSYVIRGALNTFGANDELYWNVTGNGWAVSVASTSARVTLPQASAEADIKATCYAGPYGSTTTCPLAAVSGNGVAFAGGPFGPNEGLAIVLQFPKSFVPGPTPSEQFADFLGTYWPVALIIAVIAVATGAWLRRRSGSNRGMA